MYSTRSPILRSFSTLSGKIGILGGTFDPVHLGHLAAAKHLLQVLNLSCCVFIPTHANPLKENSPLATDKERFEMLVLALQDEQDLFVSDIELHPNSPSSECSYTVDTLKKIRAELNSNASLYLLIGSDLIPTLSAWRSIQEVQELALIVPYSRAGYVNEKETSDATIKLAKMVEIPLLQTSSNEIRAAIKNGSIPSTYLPPQVADYIAKKRLYH